MAALLRPEALADDAAVALARAIAAANARARAAGIDVSGSLITISEVTAEGQVVWRVSYSPRDYIGRRGGDVIIDVDPHDASIQRVLRGQ